MHDHLSMRVKPISQQNESCVGRENDAQHPLFFRSDPFKSLSNEGGWKSYQGNLNSFYQLVSDLVSSKIRIEERKVPSIS